jgi:protein AATF/BFR2
MLTLHHTLAQQHPAAAAALAATEAAQQQQQQPGKGKRSRSAAGLDAGDEQQQQQPAAVKYAGSCRTADEAWSAVDAAIAHLAGFRDASLDKWHRRTVLSSGTAALRGSSGLRALQQSVSSQVSALMADKAKLVARSQLPVELAPRPLGTPAAAAAAAQAGGSDDDDGGADGGRGGAGRRERARDAETYDEGDFYQQLLKELLESGEGWLGGSGGGGIAVVGRLGRIFL